MVRDVHICQFVSGVLMDFRNFLWDSGLGRVSIVQISVPKFKF